MNRLPDGETLKLEVFKKTALEFSGHSLLIKKMDQDNYTFFHPSQGEYRDLTLKQLKDQINQQILLNDGTDILFMKSSDYLKRLP